MNSSASEKLLYTDISVLENMGKAAAKIAFYNFDWRYVALVVHNALNMISLEIFLKNYNKSVVLKFGKFIAQKRATRIPQFVIFGKDSYDIIDMILWLDKSQYDNSAKYIIICASYGYDDTCDESNVFATLSSVFIINVIYIRSKSDTEFEMFTYDIVVPEKCVNNVPYKLDVSNNCTDDNCLINLYPRKLKNFYKCPLIVSTFHQPPFMILNNETSEPSGGDGEILNILSAALNATLKIKIPADGNVWGRYHDGNWTGSLGDVYNNHAHMSVCSLPVSARKSSNFTTSLIYNSMDIVWTAAIPPQKPSWEKLLSPLDTSIRVGLFLIFICIAIINAMTRLDTWRRIRMVLKIGPIRSSLLFYSWALFLGTSILKMPKNRSLLILVYSWIWYCFVIRSAYQAALINSLKTKIYEEYYPSFDSVLKGRHPYGGFSTLRQYYSDDPFIYENWKVLDFNESYNILDKISEGTSDFVLAYNKENIIEYLMESNGHKRLQIIPQKIISSPIAIYFKKHSALASPVNRILSFAIESGFSQIVHRNYLRHKKYIFQLTSNKVYNPLTLDNFKSCMLLMIVGWFLCLIFFIVETYCGHLEEDE